MSIGESVRWLAFSAVLIGTGYLTFMAWPEKRAERATLAFETRQIVDETARLRAEWRASIQPVCDQWRRVKARGVPLSEETNTPLASACALSG